MTWNRLRSVGGDALLDAHLTLTRGRRNNGSDRVPMTSWAATRRCVAWIR